MMLKLQLLSSNQAKLYLPFTYKKYREWLKKLEPSLEKEVLLVGASYESQPIGLLVAKIFPEKSGVALLSLFVQGNFRNQGIGTALLKKAMVFLKENKIALINSTYYMLKDAPKFEKVLQKAGWEPPTVYRLSYRFSFENLTESHIDRWLRRMPKNSDYQLIPWDKVSQKELSQIDELNEQDGRWKKLRSTESIQQLQMNNFHLYILKDETNILGWAIIEPHQIDTIYFTLYKLKKYPELNVGVIMFLMALKISIKLQMPYGLVEFKSDETRTRMSDIFFKSLDATVTEQHYSQCMLTP